MSRLNLKLLGGFAAAIGEGPPLDLATSKARALLAVLGRHPGRPHAREALAAMLWPESDDTRARANLRQALKRLRRGLGKAGGPVIATGNDALVLRPEEVTVDVERFERRCTEGTTHALAEAVALYRGELLEGFGLSAWPFDEWLARERSLLAETALGALGRLADRRLAAGEREEALSLALRQVALDPLREPSHRRVMEIYRDLGQRGRAIEQFRICRETLRRELGVDPEPETERLCREVRATRPRAAFEAGDAGAAEAASRGLALDALLARPAVAVLPFRELGRDPADVYFGDGLAEDLLTALAGWRTFPVIASGSAFAGRDDSSPPHRLADGLGARYAVDGSVRRSGRRVRINVRLVESGTGYTLWTDRFDLALDDLLAVQDEAARRMAAVVEPELERAELRRIVTRRTEDLTAWDLCLQGKSLLRDQVPEKNARARAHFARALELDPGYSDAFTGLAQGYLRDLWATPPDGRDRLIEQGLAAARRAVESDPDSSMAHLAYATAHVWAERLDVALPETALAVELNPSNAEARGGLGNRLDLAGRAEEGIVQLEASLRLDPTGTAGFHYLGFLSRAYLSVERYGCALAAAEKAVGRRPDQPLAHFRLAVCLAHLDRIDEARAALARCERLHPGFLASHAGWAPYADPARNEHFFAGLHRHRLAG